jgi:hypothetical protein
LPAPACTLATDSSPADPTPSPPGIGKEGSFDSLDMTAVGLGTSNGNLVAEIRLVSLAKSGGQPDTGPGQPDNWFVQWIFGGTAYYLRAQYAGGDATTTTVFTYGTIQTAAVETLHVPSGSATGTVNLAGNLITISVPLSSVGSPASGAALKSALFETDVQVGSPLYAADSQPAQADYKVGETGATPGCGDTGIAATSTVGHIYIYALDNGSYAPTGVLTDPSQGNEFGPYGGVSDKVTLLKGWNLINLPTGYFTHAENLEDSIESLSGHENESLVSEIATFNDGRFNVTIPDVNNQTLTRGEGIFVYVTSGPAAWTPPGTPYTSATAIHLGTGWNLIGAAWPNPGVMTDSMFNEIETGNHACVIDSGYLHPTCSYTVNAISTYAPKFDSSGNVAGAQYLTWQPVQPFTSAAATAWVQARTVNGVALTGNQVPFTSGMWVRALKPLTWTPMGAECQSIVNGMCK